MRGWRKPVGQAGTAAAGITVPMILGGDMRNFRVAECIVRDAGCRNLAGTCRALYRSRIFATTSEPPGTSSFLIDSPGGALEAPGADGQRPRVAAEDQERAADRHLALAVRLAGAEDAAQVHASAPALCVPPVVAAEQERGDVEDVAGRGLGKRRPVDDGAVGLRELERHVLDEEAQGLRLARRMAGGWPQDEGEEDRGGDRGGGPDGMDSGHGADGTSGRAA